MVLVALVDYQYCFTVVDTGAYGCNSDGGISMLGRGLEANTIDVPQDKALNALVEGPMPHVIVEEDFLLKTYLLPYPGKNLSEDQISFNYMLSCARCIVENALHGILAARFRVY